MAPERHLRWITKAELRKIKREVAAWRKKGEEVWTDDEVAARGFTLEDPTRAKVAAVQETGIGSLVRKSAQQQEWDCGLACVQMVLETLGLEECTHEMLRARLSSDSVWSIDLAYLLADFGVACQFLSANLGQVDEASKEGEAFYGASLAEDAARVRLLFAAAPGEGVGVAQRTLSAAEIYNLVRDEEHIVLALVDASLLFERPPDAAAPSFAGHYVLLTGLDDERDGFLIKDPANRDAATFVTAAALERARRAEGTDEDLLLVPVFQASPRCPAPDSTPRLLAIVRAARDRAASS